jgi:2-polyprenyl-3-methyl-5-hydroxy-6-metoxy-1,4-benzoquinol methylase
MKTIKQSSYTYGNEYQNHQVEKYRNRQHNHWKYRIQLAFDLVEKFAKPAFQNRKEKELVVVDVGCSIGTFAIEFAKLGYQAYGIDFDSTALEIGKELSNEEDVNVIFINSDISNWSNLALPKIDIAVCFDIFEHLHDDELGSLLTSIKNQLSENGRLIFHTFPTEYDYLFYFERSNVKIFTPCLRRIPLMMAKNLPEKYFERFVRVYASFFDILYLLLKGRTYKDSIKNNSHCNPLTKKRLEDILIRSGYEILDIETTQLYQFKNHIYQIFSSQPISHRNLFGAAIKK